MTEKLINRFATLIEEGEHLYNSLNANSSGYNAELSAKAIEWTVKSQNIIELACGKDSHYLTSYLTNLKPTLNVSTKMIISRLVPILRAAKDDLENGFLVTIKQIIQAEVFDSELEQASHFLDSGYTTAAAVTAGVVLETAIKELCKNNGIPIFPQNSNKPKRLDMLNADLAKAGIYTVLQQKRITALADIRNNAAHGNVDQFNVNDVKDMIRDVERFLIDYVS